MNNNKRLDSGQSLLSALSENSQPGAVLDISQSSNSHRENSNRSEADKDRNEARALKEEIINLSRQFGSDFGRETQVLSRPQVISF